jgi:hypothetical protein
MSSHQVAAERPIPRYIRQPQVRQMLGGITPKTLKRLIDDGIIPPPFEFSRRLKLFSVDVVVAAVERTRKAA